MATHAVNVKVFIFRVAEDDRVQLLGEVGAQKQLGLVLRWKGGPIQPFNEFPIQLYRIRPMVLSFSPFD